MRWLLERVGCEDIRTRIRPCRCARRDHRGQSVEQRYSCRRPRARAKRDGKSVLAAPVDVVRELIGRQVKRLHIGTHSRDIEGAPATDDFSRLAFALRLSMCDAQRPHASSAR
jgi:hypothetical protein